MQRILMVSTISRFLRDFLFPFAEHYRALGWQVDALTSHVAEFPECNAVYDRVWEVSWSRSPFSPHNLWETPATIQRIVEEGAYDLVHVHTPVAAFVTRYALRHLRAAQRVKVIYTAHGFHFIPGNPSARSAMFLALEKLAGLWTDHLVVINTADKTAARRHRLVPFDRLWHFPGIGIDVDYYHPAAIPSGAAADLRVQHDIPADAALFTVVAEMIPRKRHMDVLEAFRQVRQPHAHLALAGDGPLREQLVAYVRKHHLSSRVHFLGFQNDIRALMHTSTALILASRQEGLPRCIMEGMALGVPVIGTDIRGTYELLADGAGLLVPLGDTRTLANSMRWVMAHPEQARECAANGRQRITEYRLERLFALHDHLYATALESKPAKAPVRTLISEMPLPERDFLPDITMGSKVGANIALDDSVL